MRTLLGGTLLAVGILVAGASGLCTLVFLVMSVGGGGGGIVPLALVVGGVPFLVGLGMISGGRALIRADRR